MRSSVRTSRCDSGSGLGSIREGARPGLVAAAAPERLNQQASFELLEVHAGRRQFELIARADRLRHRREVARIETIALREQHRPFDDVAQLADVARPAVALSNA